MTIMRHYSMICDEGKEAELEAVLNELADFARTLDGCESMAVLRDQDQPRRFFLIETWTTVFAHMQAGSKLPQEAVATLRGAVGDTLQGAYLDFIKSV